MGAVFLSEFEIPETPDAFLIVRALVGLIIVFQSCSGHPVIAVKSIEFHRHKTNRNH